MRDMVEYIPSTLAHLGIPVVFQAYPTGQKIPPEYITFLEYNSSAELEAGDVELERERLIQINVWSKENHHTLVQKVIKGMEQAGFENTNDFDTPYQDGDSHFNKVLRFAFFDDY